MTKREREAVQLEDSIIWHEDGGVSVDKDGTATDYPTQRDYAEHLRAELARALAEIEEESSVRERLAQLLAGTAIALKGEEKPLHSHGWSDLPKVAYTLKLACDISEELLSQEREKLATATARAEASERDAEHIAGRQRALDTRCLQNLADHAKSDCAREAHDYAADMVCKNTLVGTALDAAGRSER